MGWDEDDYKQLKRNLAATGKVKPRLLTQQKRTACETCGKPLPKHYSRYCCAKCRGVSEQGRVGYGKSKKVKVTGYKLNHCRYCGLRADSSDIKRRYTDTDQVAWFRCPCRPEEAQLVNVIRVGE